MKFFIIADQICRVLDKEGLWHFFFMISAEKEEITWKMEQQLSYFIA